MYWLVLGLNRGRAIFYYFRCSNDFILQKVYFSRLILWLHLVFQLRATAVGYKAWYSLQVTSEEVLYVVSSSK
jgi:hypothetical protein